MFLKSFLGFKLHSIIFLFLPLVINTQCKIILLIWFIKSGFGATGRAVAQRLLSLDMIFIAFHMHLPHALSLLGNCIKGCEDPWYFSLDNVLHSG